jgi:hypothetical protein
VSRYLQPKELPPFTRKEVPGSDQTLDAGARQAQVSRGTETGCQEWVPGLALRNSDGPPD